MESLTPLREIVSWPRRRRGSLPCIVPSSRSSAATSCSTGWRSTASRPQADVDAAKQEPITLEPLSRHLPRPHAVLRRARAPLHHRAARQRRAVRRTACASRPPPSRRGKPPPTRTPTSARVIRTSARAGAVPSGGSTATARDDVPSSARSSSTAPARSRRTSATSRVVDKVDWRARRGARRRSPARSCRCAT